MGVRIQFIIPCSERQYLQVLKQHAMHRLQDSIFFREGLAYFRHTNRILRELQKFESLEHDEVNNATGRALSCRAAETLFIGKEGETFSIQNDSSRSPQTLLF